MNEIPPLSRDGIRVLTDYSCAVADRDIEGQQRAAADLFQLPFSTVVIASRSFLDLVSRESFGELVPRTDQMQAVTRGVIARYADQHPGFTEDHYGEALAYVAAEADVPQWDLVAQVEVNIVLAMFLLDEQGGTARDSVVGILEQVAALIAGM